MKVDELDVCTYMFTFTDDELLCIFCIAEKAQESVADCLAAFFSGCLCNLNSRLPRKGCANELEGQNEGMGRR